MKRGRSDETEPKTSKPSRRPFRWGQARIQTGSGAYRRGQAVVCCFDPLPSLTRHRGSQAPIRRVRLLHVAFGALPGLTQRVIYLGNLARYPLDLLISLANCAIMRA